MASKKEELIDYLFSPPAAAVMAVQGRSMNVPSVLLQSSATPSVPICHILLKAWGAVNSGIVSAQ